MPEIISVIVDEDGNRVSTIEREDGSQFEVRVPKGAMTMWEEYAPPISITDL